MALTGVGGTTTVAPTTTTVAAPQTAAAAPTTNDTTGTIDQNMADQDAQNAQANAMAGQFMSSMMMNQFMTMNGQQEQQFAKDKAKREEAIQEMKK